MNGSSPVRIYLDNNATTAIDPGALRAIHDAYALQLGNASSTHAYGQQARGLLTKARKQIADLFGVKPQEIVFTSGATEGLNWLIRGIASTSPKGHIITTDLEHAAVYNTVRHLEQQGYDVSYLKGGQHGAATVEAVRQAIRPDTCLITLMAANNETGVLTDIEGVAQVAEEHGIPFVVDGVAAIGKEGFTIAKGISAVCFSAHKFHGPHGVGFAVVRSYIKVPPLIFGGGQENDRRSGTENLPGIIGMTEALSVLAGSLKADTARIEALRNRFETELKKACPGMQVNGDGPRICNTSNLAFPGLDGESLLMALDMDGVAASHGSACASGALEPSRVLLNMGYPRDRVTRSIRFSLSRFTTDQEIDRAVAVLRKHF
jgi:cysteine desulfurase